MTVGAALVAVILFDVFQTVVVPRRTTSLVRVSPIVVRRLWPLWRRYAVRLHPAWRREDFLATFAPFMIVFLLAMWVSALIFGYAMTLHALGDQVEPRLESFASALYLAGVSLLTIGFGDLVPVGSAARVVTLLAAASGLAIVALVISLIFNLYSSFARREVLVLLLDSRAGVPPSGVTLLETYGRGHIMDELSGAFAIYETWTAEMLDSHLAYAILPFFRSSHDGQSWVSALGAVLDAATLLLTTIEEQQITESSQLRKSRAAAEMMYRVGCHALVDLTQVRFARRRLDKLAAEPGIDRGEFDAACRRLAEAGYQTDSSDSTWHTFAERRAVYASRLNLLAQYFASPATQWIGDRTVLAHLHHADHLGP